jgi:hypothetical protein
MHAELQTLITIRMQHESVGLGRMRIADATPEENAGSSDPAIDTDKVDVSEVESRTYGATPDGVLVTLCGKEDMPHGGHKLSRRCIQTIERMVIQNVHNDITADFKVRCCGYFSVLFRIYQSFNFLIIDLVFRRPWRFFQGRPR